MKTHLLLLTIQTPGTMTSAAIAEHARGLLQHGNTWKVKCAPMPVGARGPTADKQRGTETLVPFEVGQEVIAPAWNAPKYSKHGYKGTGYLCRVVEIKGPYVVIEYKGSNARKQWHRSHLSATK